jgi:hypothetical protein
MRSRQQTARTRARCMRAVACGRGRAEDNHAHLASERVRSDGGCPPPLDNRAPEHPANPVRACPPRPQALPPRRDLVFSRRISKAYGDTRISSQESCGSPSRYPRRGDRRVTLVAEVHQPAWARDSSPRPTSDERQSPAPTGGVTVAWARDSSPRPTWDERQGPAPTWGMTRRAARDPSPRPTRDERQSPAPTWG